MSYEYYAKKLEESVVEPVKKDDYSSYAITKEDCFDIVKFLTYVLNDSEYDRAIEKIYEDFPQTKLKPIKIPKIYDIPRDVQAKYNERGYKLIKK